MSRPPVLPSDIQSGKRAFKALAKAFGGQVAVGVEVGERQQEISDMGNPNSQTMPPLWLIDHLEDRTVGLPGWPHVTNWLCRRRGGVFMPLPDVDDTSDSFVQAVIAMSAELGDVSRSIGDALRDGKIEAREAMGAIEEVNHVIDLAVALRARLQGVVDGGAL